MTTAERPIERICVGEFPAGNQRNANGPQVSGRNSAHGHFGLHREFDGRTPIDGNGLRRAVVVKWQ